METTPSPTSTERPLKAMKPNQTNCDEKDEKGKPCWGPLKVWHTAPSEIRQKAPAGVVLYRCQACLTVYYGPPRELPLRRIPRRVSILGW
ncbi:hypothetical protein HRbin10_01585 [bacterium HR10]|uniref:Uncharacterized protein n=1 Tax=uncultured Acidobacteriota bacterium TaxID=171953 RepID=H5SPN8_9BACT|nr:hypothetical protein HGMM_F54F02C07 [uncultured Acidobacteriota bacterium]GBC82460.1 hypothetical protein HRbin10_01585 [bacterium HR10]